MKAALDEAVPANVSQEIDARFRSLSLNETGNRAAYQIGASDVLGVSVFQVPELNTDVQVAADGTITLPLVGTLGVGGKQPQEVGDVIAARLRAKYLQSPQVLVFVKGYNSQKILVSGAVTSPGTIAIHGETTLLSAIADAKGFTDLADTKTVVVFRRLVGRKYAARFNVEDIQSGEASDLHLMTGDVVVVGSSDMKYWLKTLLPVLATAGVFVALL